MVFTFKQLNQLDYNDYITASIPVVEYANNNVLISSVTKYSVRFEEKIQLLLLDMINITLRSLVTFFYVLGQWIRIGRLSILNFRPDFHPVQILIFNGVILSVGIRIA